MFDNNSNQLNPEITKIKAMRNRIQNRLDMQDEIEKAIQDEDWNKAYELASQSDIDIYDPFATFREAKEAVQQARKSVANVRQKRKEVQQEMQLLELYEEFWRKLDDWNLCLMNFQNELGTRSDFFHSDFLDFLQKNQDVVSKEEEIVLTKWADRLNAETEHILKVKDLNKLRNIKNNLIKEEILGLDDFNWLCETHQQIPDSRLVTRLYAKAEERFLLQRETDLGKEYQQDFSIVEKAFITANQDEFRKGLSVLETKLFDEKNLILRKVYQFDLYLWKQRLMHWERIVLLAGKIKEFDENVNSGDPKSRARVWSDEKNVSEFTAALLDLRDIPSEIFMLKSDKDFPAFGEMLVDALNNISNGLDILVDALKSKGLLESGKMSIDLDLVGEWKSFFEKMKSWLIEQTTSELNIYKRTENTLSPRITAVSSNSGSTELKPIA